MLLAMYIYDEARMKVNVDRIADGVSLTCMAAYAMSLGNVRIALFRLALLRPPTPVLAELELSKPISADDGEVNMCL